MRKHDVRTMRDRNEGIYSNNLWKMLHIQKEDPRKIDANDDDMEGRVKEWKERKCKLKSNP